MPYIPRKIPAPAPLSSLLGQVIKERDIDTTPLTFGMHSGLTPNEIAKHHPSYIKWLYESFEAEDKTQLISIELYEECNERVEEYRSEKPYWE